MEKENFRCFVDRYSPLHGQLYRGRFPMLEPGPFTTLLGGAELLGGGQLQDPRPDQGGKSAVSTLTHLITDHSVLECGFEVLKT